MRKAVIDIGSNTINLVIGELNKNELTILLEDKNHAKLAQGGINKKKMTDEAIERGVNAIAQHKSNCDKWDVKPENISAYATATIRSTENGAYFVELIKSKFGIEIEIISGDKEAALIYEGVLHGYPIADQNVLILDIGGGSNEFIHANKSGILWKHSFNLGVSRMLDRFKPNEPISAEEIKTIKSFFKQELSLLFKNVKPNEVDTLVGASGSFDTIRNMICMDKGISNETSNTWMNFDYKDIDALIQKLIPSTLEERKQMPGMILMRVDYMVIAALFIQVVLEELKITSTAQCNYALTEGALYL